MYKVGGKPCAKPSYAADADYRYYVCQVHFLALWDKKDKKDK